MRIAAWAHHPDRVGDSWRSVEHHSACDRCLGGYDTDDDRERRDNFRCCLSWPESRWGAPGAHEPRHFGSLPIVDESAVTEPDLRFALQQDAIDPDFPFESNSDGCPGSWYRTELFQSLQKYLRPELEGGFSSNPQLDRCDDKLVLELVQAYESQRLRHRNWSRQIVDDWHASHRHSG